VIALVVAIASKGFACASRDLKVLPVLKILYGRCDAQLKEMDLLVPIVVNVE
jgi:hypothetical protein